MTTTTRVLLGCLAIVFTIGLTYASVELPHQVSRTLVSHMGAPGFDATYHPEETEAFLGAYHLRVLGFAGLILTGLLIVFGLIAERRGMAAAGAVLFFLPVFGHFAASMFFLAGLAMLRVVWLPILDAGSSQTRSGRTNAGTTESLLSPWYSPRLSERAGTTPRQGNFWPSPGVPSLTLFPRRLSE
jgi:hypothetical protein